MHELPITENILEISLRYGIEAHAARITDIYIVVGQLSSYVDDAIQMYWDIISEGTIAVGARLHFRRIAAEVRCQTCQQVYPLHTPDFMCPNCGSVQGAVISGNELYVEAIEVLDKVRDAKATNPYS